MAERREQLEGRLKLGLWLGLLGPPAAWLLNLQASYSLVPWVCRHGRFFLLHVSSVAFLTLAISAGVICLNSSRETLRHVQASGNEGMDEIAPFMGHLGLAISVLFAVLIAAQAIPTFVLLPCYE